MRISIIFLILNISTSLSICQDQLAPGDSWTYQASYRVEESDICSCIVNSATVNASDPCSNVSNSSVGVLVEIIYEPGINLEKISDKSGEEVDAGDTITYTYFVANTGDVNLSNVSIEDDMIKYIRYISGNDNGDDLLNPGEVWVYEGSYLVDQDDLCHSIVNYAIVRAIDPCKINQNDSKTVKVDTICPVDCICCPEGENRDLTNIGDQRAVALPNSRAENNVEIDMSQKI
jgi:uncharacterized repeat protein (TIGR01451 family)